MKPGKRQAGSLHGDLAGPAGASFKAENPFSSHIAGSRTVNPAVWNKSQDLPIKDIALHKNRAVEWVSTFDRTQNSTFESYTTKMQKILG